MRNFHLVLLAAGLTLLPRFGAAQQPAPQPERQVSGSGMGAGASSGSGAGASAKTMTATTSSGETYTVTTQDKPGAKPRVEPEPPGRWVRTLTNVQVELTITDQAGGGAPEKKTVSMVASSGSWGRIRSAQMVREGSRDQVIDLNVDARPMVSLDGPIQLELTVVYSPPGATTGDVPRVRPTGVNQSLTVILTSGKPLVISQAADPVGDRKIIVEAKATVLK